MKKSPTIIRASTLILMFLLLVLLTGCAAKKKAIAEATTRQQETTHAAAASQQQTTQTATGITATNHTDTAAVTSKASELGTDTAQVSIRRAQYTVADTVYTTVTINARRYHYREEHTARHEYGAGSGITQRHTTDTAAAIAATDTAIARSHTTAASSKETYRTSRSSDAWALLVLASIVTALLWFYIRRKK